MSTKNNQSLVSAVNVEPLHQDLNQPTSPAIQRQPMSDTADIHIPRTPT